MSKPTKERENLTKKLENISVFNHTQVLFTKRKQDTNIFYERDYKLKIIK